MTPIEGTLACRSRPTMREGFTAAEMIFGQKVQPMMVMKMMMIIVLASIIPAVDFRVCDTDLELQTLFTLPS